MIEPFVEPTRCRSGLHSCRWHKTGVTECKMRSAKVKMQNGRTEKGAGGFVNRNQRLRTPLPLCFLSAKLFGVRWQWCLFDGDIPRYQERLIENQSLVATFRNVGRQTVDTQVAGYRCPVLLDNRLWATGKKAVASLKFFGTCVDVLLKWSPPSADSSVCFQEHPKNLMRIIR